MLTPRSYVEGGRRFLAFPADYGVIGGMRWEGFRAFEKTLRRMGWSDVDLEHCYTEENYGRMIAVFEVVSRVRD